MAQEKLISLNNLSTFKDNVDILLNNKDSYGVCSTAANVAAKVVSHSTFVLTNGASISVKFENSNTAENPTLNVNNTGAKAIYRFGTTKPGTTEATSWTAGSIVTLTYDGTNWVMNDVQESNSYKTISYAQWLEMTPAEREAEDYYIPDYPGASYEASEILYDNTESGLIANNVQSAVDELKDLIDQSGGGGTNDYNNLTNQPQINGNILTGNKTASDLGLVAAESGKILSTNDYTNADKAIVDGVTAALAGKQGTLTAGKYINIDANNEISVEREIPNEAFTYTIQQTGDGIVKITKTVDDAIVFEETYDGNSDVTLDALHYVYNNGIQSYTLFIASDTHEVGFKQVMSWWARETYTENFSTVDHSGEKLIIKSELDAKIDTIKDGTNIDSFSDVETALSSKQDDIGLSIVNGQLCVTYSTT